MIPAWIVQTPYRGGVNGIRVQVTVARFATSRIISPLSGQALKNCSSFISKRSRTLGTPDPIAIYSATSTMSPMPKRTLLRVEFQSLRSTGTFVLRRGRAVRLRSVADSTIQTREFYRGRESSEIPFDNHNS